MNIEEIEKRANTAKQHEHEMPPHVQARVTATFLRTLTKDVLDLIARIRELQQMPCDSDAVNAWLYEHETTPAQAMRVALEACVKESS